MPEGEGTAEPVKEEHTVEGRTGERGPAEGGRVEEGEGQEAHVNPVTHPILPAENSKLNSQRG